jgi:hypothetical protein
MANKKSVVTGKTAKPAPNVSGGLGVQGVNMPNYLARPTAATSIDASTATRDKFYGGKSMPTRLNRSVVGGLGIAPFGSGRQRNIEIRTPKNASTVTRNLQYGNSMVNPAAAPAPIKAQVKPGDVINRVVDAAKNKVNDVIRTTVNMKNSPTPKRGTNLGVTTGKVTGTSATRGGTGGRTTGGGRAAGGGYTNAGPAGPGASGRGTGGKR